MTREREWDNIFNDLPSSLTSQVLLYDNLDTLKKINFIGIGSLSFIMALARYILFY